MFSKYSRYRKLPDVVTTDPRGRTLASKQLRLTPEVEGAFLHLLEEGDRLDHLAYTYYRQTRAWWRFCDADADFLSPHALLGREPVATVLIPLTWDGLTPPWSSLVRAMAGAFGVEAARMSAALPPTLDFEDGAVLFALDPALVPDLDAAVGSQTLSPALDAALSGGGLVLSADLAVTTDRPAGSRWRITDRAAETMHTIRFFADENLVNVQPTAVRHGWRVRVEYHAMNTNPATLAVLAEGLGFAADTPALIGRMGKPMVIPSRTRT